MNTHSDLEPGFEAAIRQTMATRSPYWSLLGIELLKIKKGWAKLHLPFDKKLTHPYGIAHGGAIFSLADSAVAMALLGVVAPEDKFVTVEMKINYLSTFTDGALTAEARIVHQGRQTALGDVDVRNEAGNLIAKGTATYMIIKGLQTPDG